MPPRERDPSQAPAQPRTEPKTILLVHGLASGDSLLLDGKEVAVPDAEAAGKAQLEVKEGSHQLKVTRPAHRDWTGEVSVKSGQTVSVTARPERLVGEVVLEKLPPGARALLDGQEVMLKRGDDGTSDPVTLGAGTHELTVTAQGFGPYTARVSIEAGKQARHAVAMTVAEEPNRNRKFIDAGIAYLRSQQALDGSWQYFDKRTPHTLGVTALCGLALLEAGIKPDDRAVARAAKAAREQSLGATNTYNLALGILFLDRVGDPADDELIASLAVRLLAGQDPHTGGWGYECPKLSDAEVKRLQKLLWQRDAPDARPAAPRDPKTRHEYRDLSREMQQQFQQVFTMLARPHDPAKAALGDNSNVQLAALALWVARRHGIPIEAAARRINTRFRDSQKPDGGWGYIPGPPADMKAEHASTSTMSCAGLLGLAVGFGSNPKRPAGPPKDPAVTKAQEYLGKWLEEPGAVPRADGKLGGVPAGGVPYYLWGLERVCQIYSVQLLDGKDWYGCGTAWAIKNQRPDGSWPGDYGAVVNTSLVLLFLERSNLVPDLTRQLQ
jgi:hypothetical protein